MTVNKTFQNGHANDQSGERRSRRTDPLHFVFRRDPAPAPRVPLDVIAVFHSGHRLLIGTAGNREDAEALRELVVIRPGSVVTRVEIERRTTQKP